MNNYHIYEAIGRGKHSVVYKGRKKKTIEYYAVKSDDKSQRSKVLRAGKILHKLDHPNIVKFYNWYETSGHLWLILEYCVGGDLMNLLGQDKRLPEDAIHDIALDLVAALQYLHSRGIIYCDLKPSNILLDENGRTKLCDFGMARYVTDISATALSTLPQGKRGTPCYMAPELFQDGGVHSYASDFWALGCVLYECYTGQPPFEGKEFTQLVKSILSDPMPPLSGNPSSSFVDLINCLLQKDLSARVKWPELCRHRFWRTKFTPIPLPPQPAFDDMLQISARVFLSERNGDKPVQQRTPSKYLDRDSNGTQKLDETCGSGLKGLAMPVKNVSSGRKPHSKISGRVDDRQRGNTNATGANLLRLSRMAKLNLQRDNDKENYRRPLPKNSENDSEVKIENNDMELDFSEIQEDDAADEAEVPATTTMVENPPAENEILDRNEDIEHNLKLPDINVEGNVSVFDNSKTVDQDIHLVHHEVTPTPSSDSVQRRAPLSKPSSECAPDSDSADSLDDLSQVFWHSSDLSVRPIMAYRKADKTSEALPVLPFEAIPACDYAKLSSEQLERHNNQIIVSLSGNSQASEKQNVIKYIEMLSGNADAANIITSGPLMLLLVKMLRLPKASALRIQLASVIGLLIRHSTFIPTDLATSGIITALTNGLRDKQDKVRRFSMAALGELLFYISTLNDHNKDGNVLESPSKDNRSISSWQVSSSVIALVSSTLRRGEDDVTQLYALRTIENICSQSGDWASRFTNLDSLSNICYIYKATGKQESTRLTAGSCLVRLARFNPQSMTLIFERLSFKETASAIIKGSPREQQISLNLLNMAMLGSHMFTNMGRHLLSLVEEKLLVPGLVSLIEQGAEILRGKALIFVALLCKHSRRWLPHFFCNAKMLAVVDRLAKDKDGFVQKCVEAFLGLITHTVPEILSNVSVDIQQMLGGKRHGQATPLTGRGNSKGTSHLFLVILHLLGSSSFKQRLVNCQVLVQLANLIKLIESPFQGRDDFQMTLLRILEAVTEEASIIQTESRIFTKQILPSLAILYRGNKDGDARFLCLKILFDTIAVILNEMIDTSSVGSETMKDLRSLSDTYFLPLYPIMIEDEDPIPMYAQKILIMLIEFKCVKISDILDLRTVSQCFEFLLGDLSGANVNNVKLCLALASAPEMETKILSQLRVVRKIGILLEFVNAKGMEDFLMPTLGLCKAFIFHGVGSKKGLAYSNDPALLVNADANVVDQQHYVKDIADLSCNVGVFMELIGYPDQQVADLASECMVLLLKLAPKEATMGLLTNLPKTCHILESWHEGISTLLVLRVLYSLAFSCRQYLSQALILSIPVADIMRIEATVSTLKSSCPSSVANAASSLALELQRLPRRI